MSLTTVVERLAVQLGNVSGVERVYTASPSLIPAQGDLPAIIIGYRSPSVVVRAALTGVLQYEYRFDVRLLLMAIGQGTLDDWDTALRPYPKRIVDALCASITGGGTWDTFNKDDGTLDFTLGIIDYNGANYWGLRATITIWETISTTMEA